MIHGAVHMARPDLVCVMHSHTAAGIAVSCQKEGLLPLSQHAMRFHNRVAYHSYDSFAFNYAQREGFQKNLGSKKAMFLRDHGLLVSSTTIREAFNLHYYLARLPPRSRCLLQGVEYVLRIPRSPRKPRAASSARTAKPTPATGRRCWRCWTGPIRRMRRVPDPFILVPGAASLKRLEQLSRSTEPGPFIEARRKSGLPDLRTQATG